MDPAVLSTPAYAILSGVYLLALTVCLALFISRRKRRPISTRSISLSVLSCVYGLLHFINLAIDLSVVNASDGKLREGWTCELSMYSSIFLLPLWAMPYFLRSYQVIFKYYWNVEKVHHSRQSHPAADGGWHHTHKSRISRKTQVALLLSVVLVHLAVALGFQWSGFDPFGGKIRACAASQILALGVLAIIYLLVLIYFIVRIWPVQDIYFIKIELIAVVCVTIPCLIVWILSFFLNFGPIFQSSWFAMLVVFLTFLTTLCLPLYLSTRSEWHPLPDVDLDEMHHVLNRTRTPARSVRGGTVDSETTQKTQSGIHDNKDDSLAWYLSDEIFSDSFENFCVQAWCVELYLFFKEAPKIKEADELALISEVTRIKEKYLLPEVHLEIDIKEETRQAILKEIESGNITRKIFDPAIDEVYSILMSHVFPQWKRSSLFEEAKTKVTTPTEEHEVVVFQPDTEPMVALKEDEEVDNGGQ